VTRPVSCGAQPCSQSYPQSNDAGAARSVRTRVKPGRSCWARDDGREFKRTRRIVHLPRGPTLRRLGDQDEQVNALLNQSSTVGRTEAGVRTTHQAIGERSGSEFLS